MLKFSRRAFLQSAAALGAASSAVNLSTPMAATPSRSLRIGRRNIEVLGRSASVFSLVDDRGQPGLELGPGEAFRVALRNESGQPTNIHWHGQVPVPEQDGVSDTGYVPPLTDGGVAEFDFVPRPGTHWMHSHHLLQEQSLLAGPLIVRTAQDVGGDYQDVVVLLHDFTFRDPAEILKGLTGIEGMDHGGGSMAGMDHSSMTMSDADLNDVDYDAYLANDRTLDDPLVVRTERQGKVRLRIINGASSTAFWVDVGETAASVVAVDGNDISPVSGSRFPIAQAQRLDLIVDVPAGAAIPVFAQREGDSIRTGIILAATGASVPKFEERAETLAPPIDWSLEERLVATSPLASRPVDARHSVMLTGSMSPYVWTIDDRSWSNRRTVSVATGQRVELEFMNHTTMAHPMHLHGHHFQVTSLNGKAVRGAMRDTILVPSMASVIVSFDADNPGRWLFHCHNLYHMAAGMMSELVYDV